MAQAIVELISVDQLRTEIGSPTDLQSVPGHVLNPELENIRKEVEASFIEAAEAKARAQGLDGITVEMGEPVAVDLTLSGHSLLMAEGEIDDHYFPYVFHAHAPDGTPLVYDNGIDISAATEPWPGIHYRYDVRGTKVYVLPKTLEGASFFMPTKKSVASFVMAGEVPKYNAVIIDRARKMLASLIKEQTRLEMGEPMEED